MSDQISQHDATPYAPDEAPPADRALRNLLITCVGAMIGAVTAYALTPARIYRSFGFVSLSRPEPHPSLPDEKYRAVIAKYDEERKTMLAILRGPDVVNALANDRRFPTAQRLTAAQLQSRVTLQDTPGYELVRIYIDGPDPLECEHLMIGYVGTALNLCRSAGVFPNISALGGPTTLVTDWHKTCSLTGALIGAAVTLLTITLHARARRRARATTPARVIPV